MGFQMKITAGNLEGYNPYEKIITRISITTGNLYETPILE